MDPSSFVYNPYFTNSRITFSELENPLRYLPNRFRNLESEFRQKIFRDDGASVIQGSSQKPRLRQSPHRKKVLPNLINPLTTAHFVTHRSCHMAGIVLRCASRTANFWVGMHFCENIFQ